MPQKPNAPALRPVASHPQPRAADAAPAPLAPVASHVPDTTTAVPSGTQQTLASILGALLGVTGLPEGVTPEMLAPDLAASPDLASRAQNAMLPGMLIGMALPLPGGAKTRAAEEVAQGTAHLARNLGGAAKTVFHGSGRAELPSLAHVLEKGPSRGWAATPGIYTTDTPGVAAHYATLAEKPGRIIPTEDAAHRAILDNLPAPLQELLLAMRAMPVSIEPRLQGLREGVADAARFLKIANPGSDIVSRARWIIGQMSEEQLGKYFSIKPGRAETPGYIHELKLHADPSRMVNWTQDVLQQPREVRQGLLDVLDLVMPNTPGVGRTGRAVLSGIQSRLTQDNAAAEMPALMRKAGIEGVQFPSGIFSGAVHREPGMNFVSYGDDLLEGIRRHPMLEGLFKR